jgi:hypothetical protein
MEGKGGDVGKRKYALQTHLCWLVKYWSTYAAVVPKSYYHTQVFLCGNVSRFICIDGIFLVLKVSNEISFQCRRNDVFD